MHQPAGRVVDEHEQRALRPAILKPPMLATVDLHQFAGALAPVAGLMNALQALLAIEPQPSLDHPKAQGLAAENDPVQLAQLLGRQGRTEIPVALANERQRLGANLLGLALGCWGDHGASISDPPHPRPDMPPTAGIPDAAQDPTVAPPPSVVSRR